MSRIVANSKKARATLRVEATIATGKLWCAFAAVSPGDDVAAGMRVADGVPNPEVAVWECEIVELRAILGSVYEVVVDKDVRTVEGFEELVEVLNVDKIVNVFVRVFVRFGEGLANIDNVVVMSTTDIV